MFMPVDWDCSQPWSESLPILQRAMINAETHNLSEYWKDVAVSVHSLVDIYVNTAC